MTRGGWRGFRDKWEALTVVEYVFLGGGAYPSFAHALHGHMLFMSALLFLPFFLFSPDPTPHKTGLLFYFSINIVFLLFIFL